MVSELSGEAKLMHNPMGFLAFRSPAGVKDEGLLHPDDGVCFRAGYFSVFSGGLPVAGLRRPVRSQAGWVLPVS